MVRHIIGIIFAVIAFLLVMLCMPQTGAIYTHDSQSYEYAASSFLISGEMRYFGYDTPIIQWPPFYILLVAILKIFSISMADGAKWINALCFAYLLYVSALYLFDSLKEKWLAAPALVLLTASVPLIFVSGYAWTETLFIFLAVLSMVLLLTFIRKKKYSWLIASGIVTSLCWLTRYIGITIIAVLAFILFLSVKPFMDKIKKVLMYLLISCLPMSLWVLRNYLLSGTFTGGRVPGEYTLLENIELSFSVFQQWSSYLTPVFTYLAAILFVALVLCLLLLRKRPKSRKTAGEAPDLLANILFLVVYSAVLLASATGAAMDPINSRLWSPVFPFWVFVLVFLFDSLLKNIKHPMMKRTMITGFYVFVLVAVLNPVFWIQSEGLARKEALLGSKEALGLKDSPVLKLAKETITPSLNTLVISNDAAILSMHTQLKCYYPPKKNSIPIYSFSRYTERIQNFSNIYLLWSGPTDSESFLDVADFQERYEMEKVAHNNYCIIYLLKDVK